MLQQNSARTLVGVLRSGLAFVVIIALIATGSFYIYRSYARSAECRDAIARCMTEKPDTLLPVLHRCLDRDPEDPELLKCVVRTHVRAGTPDSELEPYIIRWSEVSPNDPEPLRLRMALLWRHFRYTEQLALTERYVELVPNDQNVRRELAELYSWVGRYDDSRQEFAKLIRNSTEPPGDLQIGLARAEMALGNVPEAARLLDEALSRTPNHPIALLERGIAYTKQGDDKRAIALFQRIKGLTGNQRMSLLLNYGQALNRTGQVEEAKKKFSDLDQLQTALHYRDNARDCPGDMAIQVRAARSLLDAGELEETYKLLDGAIARIGPDRQALTLLADCYARLGRQELARTTRERLAQLP